MSDSESELLIHEVENVEIEDFSALEEREIDIDDDFDDKKNSNDCIDCKYFIPGNYFSSECMICDNGSKFEAKLRKAFNV